MISFELRTHNLLDLLILNQTVESNNYFKDQLFSTSCIPAVIFEIHHCLPSFLLNHSERSSKEEYISTEKVRISLSSSLSLSLSSTKSIVITEAVDRIKLIRGTNYISGRLYNSSPDVLIQPSIPIERSTLPSLPFHCLSS